VSLTNISARIQLDNIEVLALKWHAEESAAKVREQLVQSVQQGSKSTLTLDIFCLLSITGPPRLLIQLELNPSSSCGINNNDIDFKSSIEWGVYLLHSSGFDLGVV
jgi:hypothetical protein